MSELKLSLRMVALLSLPPLLWAGNAVVVDCVALDPRTAAFASAYDAIDVRANLAIPLVKAGRMIAILSLQNAQPRHWTAEEVELAAEVAERTWATAEAARAQADLRAEGGLHQHPGAGLVPGIHVFTPHMTQDVDGRDKPGHDERCSATLASEQVI